ncbi:uncharacterized protein si:dkey-229e3.2 isoform X1 [Anguilla anguilla]|uniref:uncharacterized protein si:dkey-229e3.2 isoform X1 n=2 Tax=Anguilla anguilla TaxID=7936 RepID=UPI0015AA7CC4|nr:uncharacterized protein si:dkey-229e3.2 isoform X1 [Anguilla anguilla]XP_035247880.1 uncharacterized protein si:dkey-229e3.2 isoform X1 [Anguilla anguilla]
MNEPAILDSCDGNMSTNSVYDSSDFEDSLDFEDSPAQAVYAPVNAKLDNSFGEWTHFVEEDRWNQHHQRSSSSDLIDPLTESHLETSEHSTCAKEKIVESPSPWQIFHNSFPMVNTSEDAPTDEAEPLLQLLQKSPETSPLSSPALCDAASLWSCLSREPSGLRRSGASLCPHTLRGLRSALKIWENASSYPRNVPPAETSPVETSGVPPSPPAGPLIQTKLLAPPHHRDSPSFLYQISHQWVSKHNLRLQDHSHKKGFFF